MQNTTKRNYIKIEPNRPSDVKATTLEGARISAVSILEGKANVTLAFTSPAAEALFAVLQKVYRLDFFVHGYGCENGVYARLISSSGGTRNIQIHAGDVLILCEPNGDPEHFSRSRAEAKFSITSPLDKRGQHVTIRITDALHHPYQGIYFYGEDARAGVGVTTQAMATYAQWVDQRVLTLWEDGWYFSAGALSAVRGDGQPGGRKMEAGDLVILYQDSDPFVMSAGLAQATRMTVVEVAEPVPVVEAPAKEKQRVAIIITGEVGTGKTALTAKLAHMLSDAGFEVDAQDLHKDLGLIGRQGVMDAVKNYVPTKEYIVSEHRLVQRFEMDPVRPIPVEEALRVFPAPVRDLAQGVTNIAIVAAPQSGKTALMQHIANYLCGPIGLKEDQVFLQQLPDGGNALYPANQLDSVLDELAKHFRIAIFERGSTTNATFQSVLKSCGANGI